MKIKKIVAIVLVLLSAVACLSIAASAADMGAIAITGVTVPVVGEIPSFYFTVSGGSEHLEEPSEYDVAWYYNEQEPADIHESLTYDDAYYNDEYRRASKPGYYTVAVYLSAVEGYFFSEATSVTINGFDADIRFYNNPRSCEIYYTFKVEDAAFNEVDTVSVYDVVKPIVGAKAQYGYKLPETQEYKKYYKEYYNDPMYGEGYDPAVRWLESTVKPESKADIENADWNDFYFYGDKLVFKEGYFYTLIVDIESGIDYEFTNNTHFEMNGDVAQAYLNDRFNAQMWYTFTPEPRKAVSQITIDDVVVPVYGEVPDFNFSIPTGLGYSEASNEIWYITETIPQSVEDLEKGKLYLKHMSSGYGQETFSEKYFYTFCVYVKEDGGDFQDNLTATINGNAAKSDLRYKDDGLVGVYYTFEKLTKPNMPDEPERNEIIAIKLKASPSQLRYKYGEQLNTDGLVIEAVYENGETAIMNHSQLEFNGFDSTERGFKNVTVSYGDSSVSFEVEVYFTFWQWLLYIICFGWIWM